MIAIHLAHETAEGYLNDLQLFIFLKGGRDFATLQELSYPIPMEKGLPVFMGPNHKTVQMSCMQTRALDNDEGEGHA